MSLSVGVLKEDEAGHALPSAMHAEELRQGGSEAEACWELEDQQWRRICFQPFGNRWRLKVAEIRKQDWGEGVRTDLER